MACQQITRTSKTGYKSERPGLIPTSLLYDVAMLDPPLPACISFSMPSMMMLCKFASFFFRLSV